MTGGDGSLHLLMFAGQNCGLMVNGDATSAATFVSTQYQYDNIGFTGSSGLDWSGVDATGGDVNAIDQYAYWRCVSQGLKLSLLNPQEEDDGWWEAVRINTPIDSSSYQFHTTDSSKDNTTQGCIVPAQTLASAKATQLVNERSYVTGLLRDLKDHTFTLNPIKDDHDLKTQVSTRKVSAGHVDTYDATDIALTFDAGVDDITDLIERFTDTSMDMVYIRIHGRASGNLSRLHANIVSNQEITFTAGERESRFHTASGDIGSAMDEHIHAKRGNNAASNVHMIM